MKPKNVNTDLNHAVENRIDQTKQILDNDEPLSFNFKYSTSQDKLYFSEDNHLATMNAKKMGVFLNTMKDALIRHVVLVTYLSNCTPQDLNIILTFLHECNIEVCLEVLVSMRSTWPISVEILQEHFSCVQLVAEIETFNLNKADILISNFIVEMRKELLASWYDEKEMLGVKNKIQRTLDSLNSPECKAVWECIDKLKNDPIQFKTGKTEKANQIEKALLAMPILDRASVISSDKNAVQDEIAAHRYGFRLIEKDNNGRIKIETASKTYQLLKEKYSKKDVVVELQSDIKADKIERKGSGYLQQIKDRFFTQKGKETSEVELIDITYNINPQ